jgi:predicted hydrocarbon binding protein
MAEKRTFDYIIDHKYDPRKSRHYLNDNVSVLHCHHYITLYTQLAEDAEQFNGIEHLKDSAEETFYPVLKDYFAKHNVARVEDRVKIAEEVWRVSGMGLIKFVQMGDFSASVEMTHSHVDEGWIKKWGKRDKPVNFVTQGYLSAALAAINDAPIKSYHTIELESIVSGAEKSSFNVVRK